MSIRLVRRLLLALFNLLRPPASLYHRLSREAWFQGLNLRRPRR